MGIGTDTAVDAGIGGIANIITYFVNKADQQAANKEAKSLDARNWAEDMRREQFQETITNKSQALAQRQNAFSERQTTASNVLGINKGLIDKLTNTVNNNESLKNNVINRWAA